MRASWLVVALITAAVLAPQPVQSQGLPDILWESSVHTHTAEGVAYAPDGSFVLSGANYTDCTFRLWSASDGTPLGDFSVYPHGIETVDVAPGGSLVAVGYIVHDYAPGGVAAVWDTELGEELFTTGGCNVAFSPGGDMLASGGGGVNRYLSISDVSDGSERHSIYTGSYLLDVAYSPNGRVIATAGSDNDIQLWDPASGGLIGALSGHTDDVSAIAFSPDGAYLASGAGGWDEPSDSSIKIWRVSDGELLDTLEGHGDWVYALAFSPSGDVLVSSGRTGSTPKIKYWNLETGEMTRYYDDSAPGLDFSPDGAFIVYGRSGGDVVVARSGLLTGVDDHVEAEGDRIIEVPRPNPFSSETTISFDTPPEYGRVELAIYDVSGRLVRRLFGGDAAGRKSVVWDGTDAGGIEVASGIYYCRLETREREESIKLTLLK